VALYAGTGAVAQILRAQAAIRLAGCSANYVGKIETQSRCWLAGLPAVAFAGRRGTLDVATGLAASRAVANVERAQVGIGVARRVGQRARQFRAEAGGGVA